MQGGTLEVKGALLRELLTESNAFGYLMASGGPGGEAGAEPNCHHVQHLTALRSCHGPAKQRCLCAAGRMLWPCQQLAHMGCFEAAVDVGVALRLIICQGIPGLCDQARPQVKTVIGGLLQCLPWPESSWCLIRRA